MFDFVLRVSRGLLQPFCKGNVKLIAYYGNIFSHNSNTITYKTSIQDRSHELFKFKTFMEDAILDDVKYVVNVLKSYLEICSVSRITLSEFVSLNNEIRFVKLLIECYKAHRMDINRFYRDFIEDELWMTPLHFACKYGRTEVVKEFMKYPDVYFESRVRPMYDGSPMFCMDRHRLQYKINNPDDGLTVLHIACKYGNVDIVELLLTKMDINTSASLGRTPLQVACYAGKTKVVELLLNYAAIYDLHLIVNHTSLEDRNHTWSLRFEKIMEKWNSRKVY